MFWECTVLHFAGRFAGFAGQNGERLAAVA
jgi:hypothetical protein